jgi:hypothetical protein
MRGQTVSYVKATSEESIAPEFLEAIARLLRLSVPPSDVSEVGDALRDQLASVRSLDELDLTDIMPAVEFDPRWES